MRNWCVYALAGMALLSVLATAQAQAPTKAQQDALRSNCRSDFMRNCSSVTPGGREALECLMTNKAKVSAGCQGALNAIAAPAPAAAKPEPKAEPRAASPKSEPAPTAAAPAPPAAPSESAPMHAAPPPAARQPAAPKAVPPKAAAVPARPAAPAVPPAAAPAALSPPPPAETHQPKLGEAIMIRRFCTTDFRVLCKGVPLGQGRAIQCLANNGPSLSPGCRQAMIQTGELRP
jgi:hypothetical protein